MRPTRTALALLAALGACQTIPESAAVLTGPALAAELAGQRLVIRAPEETGIDSDLVLIAALRDDGTADLSAQLDGQIVEAFVERERWEVRGQDLCIFDSPTPEDSDCIQVDWVSEGRIQLTEIMPNGSLQSSVGTLTPL